MLTYLFEQLTYPIFLFLAITWGWTLIQRLRGQSFFLRIQENLAGILLSLILTGIVFVSVSPKYRILSDETNLISVSQSLFQSKKPQLVTDGKRYFNNFNPISVKPPNRPLLYPFTLSLVHSIFGYNYKNAFYLNSFFLFLLLLIGFLIGKSKFSNFGAGSIPFFILAQPIVSISASSAGFDLLSVLLFIYLLYLTKFFLTDRSSKNFIHLVLTAILFTQVRYENIIYAVVLFGLIAIITKLDFIKKKSSIFWVLSSAIFFIPFLLQRLIVKKSAYQVPEKVSIFSLEHFINHAEKLWTGFFQFNFYYPYASILNCLTILLSVLLVLASIRKKQLTQYIQEYPILIGAVVGTYFLVILSYFFGNAIHPSSARYFIVLAVFISILAPFAMEAFRERLWKQSTKGKLVLVVGLLAFVAYHPLAINSRFMNSLTINRETQFEYSFLEKTNSYNPLVITERPGHFTVIPISAISFAKARRQERQLFTEFARNLYSDVFIFQRSSYATNSPLAADSLPESFNLEKIEEIQTSATEFLRISKLKKP